MQCSIPEDPAIYLALRLRALYEIHGITSDAQLLRIIRDRGALAAFLDSLSPGGACFGYHELKGVYGVVASTRSSAAEKGHEAGHVVFADNSDHGIEYPELQHEDPEVVFDRFGEALAAGAAPFVFEPCGVMKGFRVREPESAPPPFVPRAREVSEAREPARAFEPEVEPEPTGPYLTLYLRRFHLWPDLVRRYTSLRVGRRR